MKFVAFVPFYFVWHYSRSLKEFWGVASNLIWFVFSFFSINILLGTLIEPWGRLTEKYGSKGLDPGQFATAFIVNTLMRVVGLVIRLVVIIIGLVVTISLVILSVAAFLLWILLPLAVVVLFIIGIGVLLP